MTAFSTEEWATALVMEKYTLARGVLNLVSCLNLHPERRGKSYGDGVTRTCG
jgi:hypothetical protein